MVDEIVAGGTDDAIEEDTESAFDMTDRLGPLEDQLEAFSMTKRIVMSREEESSPLFVGLRRLKVALRAEQRTVMTQTRIENFFS